MSLIVSINKAYTTNIEVDKIGTASVINTIS